MSAWTVMRLVFSFLAPGNAPHIPEDFTGQALISFDPMFYGQERDQEHQADVTFDPYSPWHR